LSFSFRSSSQWQTPCCGRCTKSGQGIKGNIPYSYPPYPCGQRTAAAVGNNTVTVGEKDVRLEASPESTPSSKAPSSAVPKATGDFGCSRTHYKANYWNLADQGDNRNKFEPELELARERQSQHALSACRSSNHPG